MWIRALLLLVLSGALSTSVSVVIAQTRVPQPSQNLVLAALDNVSVKATDSANAFGESLSLSTGTIGFEITDIDLPGNGPPVRLTRRFDTGKSLAAQFENRLVDWDLDLPRITTTGALPTAQLGHHDPASVWTVAGGAPYNRCSNFAAPPGFVDTHVGWNEVHASTWWMGVELQVPGHGSQPLLRRSPSFTMAPGNNPVAWPIVTREGWALSCLPSTRNGYAGEAFVARSPDGLTYRFDWFVYSRLPVARGSRHSSYDPQYIDPASLLDVHVLRASLYATRVEDGFGNYVNYEYDGARLVRIAASDGRAIQLGYVNDSQGFPKLTTATIPGTPARTWTYGYKTEGVYFRRLSLVRRPDNSAWEYLDGEPHRYIHRDDRGDLYAYGLRMRSPGGVVADYRIRERWKLKESSECPASLGLIAPLDPCAFVVGSLHEKQYAGLGVDATWRYYYKDAEYPSEPGSQTVVVAPDGSRTHYRLGNSSLSALDGQVLREDEGAQIFPEHGSWTLQGQARATVYEFQTQADKVGTAPQAVGNRTAMEYRNALKKRVISQDGVHYTRSVEALDHLARPTVVRDVGTGPARVTATTYHDDIAKWVLGQVAKVAVGNTVVSETTFTAAAQPRVHKAFGAVTQTLAYHADGTLATRTDGNGNVTSYSNWRRGHPQLIRHPPTAEAPAGATESSVVNNDGTLASVTNAAGRRTCFDYDAMGRMTRITYPSETQSGICDASAWLPTTISFAGGQPAAYGMPAGHWRQVTSTGNARRVLVLDALWRPVVEQTLDLGNVAGTMREVVKRYDARGRVAFESDPLNTAGQAVYTDTALPGVRTGYDALGRVTWTTRNSELGTLTTSMAYLPGATRVTDARGLRTTTHFLAFEAPTDEWPIKVEHPEGVRTEITRDLFGKPTSVTRSGDVQ